MSVPSHPLKPFALAIGLNRLYKARLFNIKPFSERAKSVLNDAHLNNINIQENNILAFPPWDIQIFNYHNPFQAITKQTLLMLFISNSFLFIAADTAARSMSDHMQRPVCYRDLKTSTQNYIHRVWQETWNQQILNKLHSIHPSTSHWAALPVRRHDVRLTRLRIGHTRFTHRHLLLAARYFNVRIGQSSSHKFIQDQGVPQGSVLSVTLFNIHMSNILHQLPPSVRGMLYVDDLQVSCQGSDMRLIEWQLQTTVTRLVKWCDQNGHTISPSKSSCVHFCRKRNLHPDPSIRIGNIQIPVVSAVRFLGVIFDSKLTFLPHVFYLRKKCERSLNILKVLSITLWGADRVSLLRVYQALILSRLDYGCVVYGSARTSVLKRLDTIHHSALRICSLVPSELRLLPACMWYAINHL
ncbi:putative RNA-directed DNA polymerase from transposon X-element [Trichonephila clavipes]|nr:putative RNA-directed DNA polymerase from transposon X-element [Trichonephila clavipes]